MPIAPGEDVHIVLYIHIVPFSIRTFGVFLLRILFIGFRIFEGLKIKIRINKAPKFRTFAVFKCGLSWSDVGFAINNKQIKVLIYKEATATKYKFSYC